MRQPHWVQVVLLSVVWAGPPLGAQSSKEAVPSKVKVPAEVDKVIRAGRGDVLLLQMNALAKVAVFDIKTERISGYIPLGGDEMLVAGTADNVILLARDKMIIQRWSLQPLEKTLTVALPITEQIDGLAAGYAGNAPIMIITRDGPRFINPVTLKMIKTEATEGRAAWSLHPLRPNHWAASADGLTFAGYPSGVSPSGIRTLRLEGTKLIGKYEHSSVGSQIPSADGSLLFTDDGVYNSDLKPLDGETSRQRGSTFPSIHPAYYVGATFTGGRLPGRLPVEGELSISLYNTSEQTILITFDKLPGLGKARGSRLAMSDRIIAHPSAKKLIIIDESRTLLHILPLDIVKAMDAKGIDYLFVESLPITSASDGKPYEYAIKVLSKAGKLKFTLDSGPEKMTITPEGVLRWDVPKDFDQAKTSVIVTIQDASKQSIFHSFAIHVSARPEVAKP